MRDVRDPYLPRDHDAFVAAEPPSGRIIVIAPTRAACETIELGFTLDIETVLWREHSEQLTALAAAGKPFGIVAGTGTGKTLIDPPDRARTAAHAGTAGRRDQPRARGDARDADVERGHRDHRHRAAMVPGRRHRPARDTLVVDEVHQTSAELELCLALGKRVGCRFIWLSATVDPSFYARYLEARGGRGEHCVRSRRRRRR